MPSIVWAQATCTLDIASIQSNPVQILRIGRDAVLGEDPGGFLIGPNWYQFQIFPATWTCQGHKIGNWFAPGQLLITPPAGSSPGGLISIGNKTYRIYYLNQGTPQELGYIVDVIFQYGGFQQQIPVTVGNGDIQYSSWSGILQDSTGNAFQTKTNAFVRVRTIKTIAGSPSAGASVSIPLVHLQLRTRKWLDQNTYDVHQQVSYTFNATYPNVDATCTTPAVENHTLPTVSMNEIPEVGDVGPIYAFQLKITNCPRWMRSVRYKLMAAQPGGGETVPDNSTLPLLTGSTASGVGVQIRLPNNTLHPFNEWRNVVGYPSNFGTGNDTPSNHTVQLRARIIRTAVNAQPGKIVSAIIFHMQYK